jgi:hypothetical protein
VTTQQWRVCAAPEVRDWLTRPHPQPDVALQIQVRVQNVFRKLELAGPLAGAKVVWKVRGESGLWEARVNHGTGAYRFFLTFISGRRVAIGCWKVKKSRSFKAAEYREAARKVAEYVESLGLDEC